MISSWKASVVSKARNSKESRGDSVIAFPSLTDFKNVYFVLLKQSSFSKCTSLVTFLRAMALSRSEKERWEGGPWPDGVWKPREGQVPRRRWWASHPVVQEALFPKRWGDNLPAVSSRPSRTASLENCCVSTCPHVASGSAWRCLASTEGATSWSQQRQPAHKVMAPDSFRIKS